MKVVNGVHGHHDRHANVTIEFNSQGWWLPAPDGGKYLPCNGCGRVHVVDANVVSYVCTGWCGDPDVEYLRRIEVESHQLRMFRAEPKDYVRFHRRVELVSQNLVWEFLSPDGEVIVSDMEDDCEYQDLDITRILHTICSEHVDVFLPEFHVNIFEFRKSHFARQIAMIVSRFLMKEFTEGFVEIQAQDRG